MLALLSGTRGDLCGAACHCHCVWDCHCVCLCHCSCDCLCRRHPIGTGHGRGRGRGSAGSGCGQRPRCALSLFAVGAMVTRVRSITPARLARPSARGSGVREEGEGVGEQGGIGAVAMAGDHDRGVELLQTPHGGGPAVEVGVVEGAQRVP